MGCGGKGRGCRKDRQDRLDNNKIFTGRALRGAALFFALQKATRRLALLQLEKLWGTYWDADCLIYTWKYVYNKDNLIGK